MSSSDSLADQRASYATNILAALGFGIYLVLAAQTIRRQVHKARTQKGHRLQLTYSVINFCLACTWFCTGAAFAEYVSVEIPFNPELERALTSCEPLAILRSLSGTLIIWLSDSMLLWRTYVIWEGQKVVVMFPFIIYLTSLGLGTALQLSCLGSDLGGPVTFSKTVDVALPFFGLSIGLTIICTSLISYKLLAHRRELKRAGLDSDDALATYASVKNILVESGALFAVSGIIFFPLQILQLPAVTPIGVIFTCTMFISPTLIQLRVIRGEAFSEESKLQFQNPNYSTTLDPIRFGANARSFEQATATQGASVDKEVGKF